MKKVWLVLFNIITLLTWILFLIHGSMQGLAFDAQSMLLLNIAQGLAVFEILNSILGLAGANWMLTTMQVSSRLLVLALLNWVSEDILIEQGYYSGFSVVSIAWSVTEIIRALYYLSGLFDKEISAISWSRYTFFILLYPMGVIGEFMVMFTFIEYRHFEFNFINIGLGCVALSYFVFFPKLYRHMFSQRRKKID